MTEGEDNGHGSSTPPGGVGTAAQGQGPPAPSEQSQQQGGSSSGGGGGGKKANQAAFIHKLYNMLEDSSISHLITWTPSNESFVITPGEEFSKVLAQYFKHTNVSSFVRQLNMYGFHKVNDTFNSSDYNQWEFKHGGGAFKRGDVDSLRAIKRRASRQSLQRDNLQLKSVSLSVPATPAPEHHPYHHHQHTPPVIYPGHHHQGGFMTTTTNTTTNNTTNTTSSSSNTAAATAATTNNATNSMGSTGLPAPAPAPPPPHGPPHESRSSSGGTAGSGSPGNNVDARLNALEQNMWYLQESNFGLNHRNAVLIDALKKTQADVFQLLEFLRSRDIYDETIDLLKSNLSHHMSVLSHFHDRPPHTTKSEISFNSSSSRERNPSIFYDPLANTPTPSESGDVSLPPLNREQRPGSFPVAYYRNKISRPSNAGLRPDTQAFRRHTSGEVPPTHTTPSTLAPIPSVSSRNGSTTSTSTSSGEQPRQGSSVQSLLNPPTEEERSSKRLKSD